MQKSGSCIQRPDSNILPTILPKAPILILCSSDYNRKGRLKSQGIFPNKSQPQPTHNTRKTTNPTQVPPSPTQHLNKHALIIHIHTPSHTSQFITTYSNTHGAKLTAHNWQKWKRVFLTCPCHKIYRDEAVSLKNCKYTWKITTFVKMWNLGQYRENLIFCQ